ncbi:MAG: GNAT family N-acetyltransferase [Hahellaceae bacterium]|nr:GNAT family N-acetyltransferase [Hahellaceae bacterium]MCP5170400.1 GNAT family N-acetyltransferase [Hahellaceae bacterium]
MIKDLPHPEVVRLDSDAISEAKAILYHAYKDEPTFRYLFDAERSGYEQRVRATIRELIDLHFASHQDVIGITMNGRLVAVALLGSPAIRLNLADQLNWRIRMMLTAGLASTRRYIEYHEQVTKCLPGTQRHDLPLMGVDTAHQGKGYGKLMVKAIEQLCRENPRSAGIGLDTGNEKHAKFYESLGFEKVGEVKLGNVVESVMFKPASLLMN